MRGQIYSEPESVNYFGDFDNFIIHMDKYRVFDKIIKTKACTYFKAEEEVSRRSVMVKKLNKVTTWE